VCFYCYAGGLCFLCLLQVTVGDSVHRQQAQQQFCIFTFAYLHFCDIYPIKIAGVGKADGPCNGGNALSPPTHIGCVFWRGFIGGFAAHGYMNTDPLPIILLQLLTF
jgi:hypothetical protein